MRFVLYCRLGGLMATYRRVEEEEWKAAVGAVEALAKALKRAGTVIMPDTTEPQRTPASLLDQEPMTGEAKNRLKLAKQIVDRVESGGQKHQPKVFDRVGPKIADFVYLLTDTSFTVPDVIDKVKQYVVLKDTRRDAGGQIRTEIGRASCRERV